jgi:hypothetical protein
VPRRGDRECQIPARSMGLCVQYVPGAPATKCFRAYDLITGEVYAAGPTLGLVFDALTRRAVDATGHQEMLRQLGFV